MQHSSFSTLVNEDVRSYNVDSEQRKWVILGSQSWRSPFHSFPFTMWKRTLGWAWNCPGWVIYLLNCWISSVACFGDLLLTATMKRYEYNQTHLLALTGIFSNNSKYLLTWLIWKTTKTQRKTFQCDKSSQAPVNLQSCERVKESGKWAKAADTLELSFQQPFNDITGRQTQEVVAVLTPVKENKGHSGAKKAQ